MIVDSKYIIISAAGIQNDTVSQITVGDTDLQLNLNIHTCLYATVNTNTCVYVCMYVCIAYYVMIEQT